MAQNETFEKVGKFYSTIDIQLCILSTCSRRRGSNDTIDIHDTMIHFREPIMEMMNDDV